MSSPATVADQKISNLLAVDEEYPSPAIVAENCRQKRFAEDYQRSVRDPDAFWGAYARNFVWSRPWEKVLDWDGVNIDFVDAALAWYGMGYKPGAGTPYPGDHEQAADVLFATGSGMVTRHELFTSVGGFDEQTHPLEARR